MNIKSTLVIVFTLVGIQYSNTQTKYPIKQASQEVNAEIKALNK